MSMTSEELYDQQVQALAIPLLIEHLNEGVDYFTVQEALKDLGFEGEDVVRDVREYINGELETLLQIWEDQA